MGGAVIQPMLSPLRGALSIAFRAAALRLPTILSSVCCTRGYSGLAQPFESSHLLGEDSVLRLLVDPTSCGSSADHEDPLKRYRSEFPPSVWSTIKSRFAGNHVPTALDIAVSSGTSAVELAKRGFRVTGIHPDERLLARARAAAVDQKVHPNFVESTSLDRTSNSVDLVTVMHGLHLVDPDATLAEVQKLLRKDGYLVTAFNDRDIHCRFVLDLEDLLETYNPEYVRSAHQHVPAVWTKTLVHGGAFELESYTCHPHGLFMHGSSSLVDLFQSMNSMRPVLAASSAKRKRFSQDLALLAYEHYGNNSFCLPLTTRLYIMKKQGKGDGGV